MLNFAHHRTHIAHFHSANTGDSPPLCARSGFVDAAFSPAHQVSAFSRAFLARAATFQRDDIELSLLMLSY
jgi:hypothetical protein